MHGNLESLARLKGYQDWLASEQSIRYADDVVPAGVLARIEAHKQDLFDAQHERAKALEFILRAIRYGTEIIIWLSKENKKYTRSLIGQLQRHTGVVQTIIYRNWLGLNNHQTYRKAEQRELRRVMHYAHELRVKLDDKALPEAARAYLDDVQEVLSIAAEWIGLETAAAHEGEWHGWANMLVAPDVVARLLGVDYQGPSQTGSVAVDGVAWLDNKQAAEFLGVRPTYMRQMRVAGTGPAYSKVKSGRGAFEERIIYETSDILDWLLSKPETANKVLHRNAPAALPLRARLAEAAE